MYNIRDDVIPNGKIDELKKYLENDIFLEETSMTQIMEILYGCAISMNNIQINKLNTIEQIYYADCRNEWNYMTVEWRLVLFRAKQKRDILIDIGICSQNKKYYVLLTITCIG